MLVIKKVVIYLGIAKRNNLKTNQMKTNQLINYANAKGMNIATATNEFGDLRVGIEWKSNCVYYWFMELRDGDLMFIERYSQRTGSSKRSFTMTQVNIRESVESFNA